MPNVDRDSEAVARNVLDPGVPHERVYLVEVNKVSDNVVHQPVETVGCKLDLVVLDYPLYELADVRGRILVAAKTFNVNV